PTRPIRSVSPRFQIYDNFKLTVRDFFGKIHAAINVLLVDSGVNGLKQEYFSVHRAGAAVGGVMGGTHPLEVTHQLTINSGVDIVSLGNERRLYGSTDDWLCQVIWGCCAQCL